MERDPTAAIEINDVGLILAEEGRLADPDPGMAFFSGNRLLLGVQARRFWRTLPSQSNDRFWEDLSSDPMERPLGHALSTADLAHAHLSSVWASRTSRPTEVSVALGSAFERERMGLLLGIAQSLSIPISAMVDAALVCAASAAHDITRVLHVDIEFHRCVITTIERDREWIRAGVEVLDELGWLVLMERWVCAAADRFIRTTRFDPLHRAEDEQKLHDLLPGCLETLVSEKEAQLELGRPDGPYSVVVPRQEFAQAVLPLVEDLLARVEDHVGHQGKTLCQMTRRLQACPGFESLARRTLSCETQMLPRGFAAVRARECIGALRAADGSVPFVTKLPTEAFVAPPTLGAVHGP